MTTKEKNFIRDWQIQKEGAKWKYYLQYIIAWSTVIFLSLFFITKLILEDRGMAGLQGFFIILSVSVLSAVLITHFVYQTNEKKFKRILEREDRTN